MGIQEIKNILDKMHNLCKDITHKQVIIELHMLVNKDVDQYSELVKKIEDPDFWHSLYNKIIFRYYYDNYNTENLHMLSKFGEVIKSKPQTFLSENYFAEAKLHNLKLVYRLMHIIEDNYNLYIKWVN